MANPYSQLVPASARAWVSAELIEETLRVWQPYYADPLTVDDAVDIMLAAAGLLKAIAHEGQSHEAVCRTSARQ